MRQSKANAAPGVRQATGRAQAYHRPMPIRVECYAGFRAEQEPIAFWSGERRFEVKEIVDRWYSPTQRWFRVDADDGNLYVLRHDEQCDDWEIAAFTARR
jgi:hypothetical protein